MLKALYADPAENHKRKIGDFRLIATNSRADGCPLSVIPLAIVPGPPRSGIITRMTIQTVREMLGRRPFQPVKITLSSGQSYEIRHPEMALLTRTDLLIGVDVADDGVPAKFKILSLLHVTAIETLAGKAA